MDRKSTEKRVVNPWDTIPFDPKTQSGGDWYRTLLCASMGGRVLHGVNAAPSNEVLVKRIVSPATREKIGYLRWDGTIKQIPVIGNDISDQAYLNKDYLGIATSPAASIAFDIGPWAPERRIRARNAAILAAGLVVHGANKIDAMAIMDKILGDKMDIEALESTTIPASHLKREMSTVTKASYKVFTRGTLQRGITWDDGLLIPTTESENVAIDWGRVTNIARYIAEANIQVDRLFAALASSHGVPFTLVKNAWAFVSSGDYIFTKDAFASVPDVDLAAYKIPTLKEAFINHEEEVLEAAGRAMAKMDDDPPALSALYKIVESAKARIVLRKDGRHPHGPREDATYDAFLPEYEPLSDELILAASISSKQAWYALVDAYNVRRLSDYTVERLHQDATLTLANKASGDFEPLIVAALDRKTWQLALSNLVVKFGTLEGAVPHISSLRRQFFGNAPHVDVVLRFSATMLIRASGYIPALIKDANERATKRVIPTGYKLHSTSVGMTSAMTTFVKAAEENLDSVSAIYIGEIDKWMIEVTEKYDEIGYPYYYKYLFAKTAIEAMSLTTLMNAGAGYIDGSAPKQSYPYVYAKLISSDFGVSIPGLKSVIYPHAEMVANEIDSYEFFGFRLSDFLAFTVAIIGLLVGDIVAAPSISLGDYYIEDDRAELYEAIKSPDQYPKIFDDPNPGLLAQLFGSSSFARELEREVTYDEVLATYASIKVANSHAVANGYLDFLDAFNKIKGKARYDDESQYTINGEAAETLRSLGASEKKARTDFGRVI